MDLIHDTYEEISSKESMHRLTGRSGKISVQFTKAREKIVAPEFQERMTRIPGCFHAGRTSEEQRGDFHRIQSHNRSLAPGQIYCETAKRSRGSDQCSLCDERY